MKMNPLYYNFKECKAYTRNHAKSFYFSSLLLPKEKREAAYAVYSFCRYADNLIDDAVHSSPDKLKIAIHLLHEGLDAAYSEKKDFTISFSAFAKTVKKYNIPKYYFKELIEGVTMDINTKRYDTFTDLEIYCYKVASVVGLIMCRIFGYTDNSALSNAIYLGKAMQLTNIIRDIYEDYKMGRIYLPDDEMKCFEYSADDMGAKKINENFKDMMSYQVKRARGFYELAKKGFPYLTNDGSRTTVVLMSKIYSGILDKIEQNNYDIYSKRLFVKTTEKITTAAAYLLNFKKRKEYSAIPQEKQLISRIPGYYMD